MRTAEEIIKRIHPHYKNPESDFQWVVNLINEARIEAIQECIEISHEQGVLGYPEIIEPQLKKLLEKVK
jgi:hypothetical protein